MDKLIDLRQNPALQARIAQRRARRKFQARIAHGVLLTMLGIVILGLFGILAVLIVKGAPSLSLEVLTQPPKGGYYAGGKGGILNAIEGSLLLALGGTLIALLLGLPLALYLNAYADRSRVAGFVRLTMDVLWGVPSLIYGAFAFSLMLFVGLKASLLAGIVTLGLVELPILARGMDEVLRLSPRELVHGALAMGATRLELIPLLIRQALPGLITALLLAFGRGIGDAAAVLFTAGYTDRLPSGLLQPVASLPLAVFFQLNTPYAASQARAYAAALVLTGLVFGASLLGRLVARVTGRYVVR